MAQKLSSPLKGKIKITQTTHGHNKSNTQDLSFQRAVDMNSYSDDVLAEADGIMQAYSNTGDYRSFLQPLYNGLSVPKQLVHAIPVKKFAKNEKIKRGQLIGKLAPSVYDPKTKRYTFLKHLHNTFYDSTGKGKAPDIFSYMDRSIQVYAEHPEILATSWFKNGVFQWSKFKDLYISMTLPNGSYEIQADTWIKQSPDTKAPNFAKAIKGAVGTISSGVKTSNGVDFQYITFRDVGLKNGAGWIPNTSLKATTKSITPIGLEVPLKPCEEMNKQLSEQLGNERSAHQLTKKDLAESLELQGAMSKDITDLTLRVKKADGTIANLNGQINDLNTKVTELKDTIKVKNEMIEEFENREPILKLIRSLFKRLFS